MRAEEWLLIEWPCGEKDATKVGAAISCILT
jgi:hypothetical protein